MTHSENPSGIIFVMIGPGGVGKNTIMKAIINQSDVIQQLATATTRPLRDGEKQGREHLFISLSEFQKMIANNELLEYQEVTPNKFYGVPRQSVAEIVNKGHIRIADIDVLGAKELAKAFPDHVVQIYITVAGETLEEQLQVLKARMIHRNDNTTDIDERLKRAKELELPYQSECDHIVVNDTLSQAIDDVSKIIQSEFKKRQLVGQQPS